MVFENLVALWIAIEKECCPEVAFKYLDRYLGEGKIPKGEPLFVWTDDDIQDILTYRREGITLKEIGSYYFITDQAVHKAIKRYKEKIRSCI